jgi:hypothetical protein
MTMPFQVMPFEKRFLKKCFSSQISSKPPSQEREHRKKEKRRRREKKKKAPRVSSNKREVHILRGEKHFNFIDPFLCDSIFSPSIIYFQKPFSKPLRKFS